MCRHIYDWNIVNCDVKQTIQLNSTLPYELLPVLWCYIIFFKNIKGSNIYLLFSFFKIKLHSWIKFKIITCISINISELILLSEPFKTLVIFCVYTFEILYFSENECVSVTMVSHQFVVVDFTVVYQPYVGMVIAMTPYQFVVVYFAVVYQPYMGMVI